MRRRSGRWKCVLCDAFGYADTTGRRSAQAGEMAVDVCPLRPALLVP